MAQQPRKPPKHDSHICLLRTPYSVFHRVPLNLLSRNIRTLSQTLLRLKSKEGKTRSGVIGAGSTLIRRCGGNVRFAVKRVTCRLLVLFCTARVGKGCLELWQTESPEAGIGARDRARGRLQSENPRSVGSDESVSFVLLCPIDKVPDREERRIPTWASLSIVSWTSLGPCCLFGL